MKNSSKKVASHSQKEAWLKELVSKFLLITFTDAAAIEMRERLAGSFVAQGYEIAPNDIPAMTFNAFYMDAIKKMFEQLGFKKVPGVIDTNPVRVAAKVLPLITGDRKIDDLNYAIPVEMNMGLRGVQGALALTLSFFDILRETGVDSNTSLKEVNDIAMASPLSKKLNKGTLVSDLFSRYEEFCEILKEESMLTFRLRKDLNCLTLGGMRQTPLFVRS